MSSQNNSNQKQKVSLPDSLKTLGLPPVAPPQVVNWREDPPDWWKKHLRQYETWLRKYRKLLEQENQQSKPSQTS